jgi:hypothetical protein
LNIASRADLLKKLFGETVTRQVFEDYGNRMDSANRSGNLRMLGSGTLGFSASIGSKVPRHQFFGDR